MPQQKLAEEGKTNKELADQLAWRSLPCQGGVQIPNSLHWKCFFEIVKALKRDVRELLVSNK